MKGVAGYVLASVALAVLGGVSLVASLLDREILQVHQDLATLRYDESEDALERIERHFEYASRVPWIGNAPLNEVRAQRAASRYWRHAYGGVASDEGNPVAAVPADNVDLQLIVANALYRSGAAQAKDRQAALQALDAGVGAYLTVLKNSVRNADAAYNFEYLVRVRDEMAKGRRKPSPARESQNSLHGLVGAAADGIYMNDFKMHVPMSKEEIDERGRKEAGEGRQPRKPG